MFSDYKLTTGSSNASSTQYPGRAVATVVVTPENKKQTTQKVVLQEVTRATLALCDKVMRDQVVKEDLIQTDSDTESAASEDTLDSSQDLKTWKQLVGDPTSVLAELENSEDIPNDLRLWTLKMGDPTSALAKLDSE